MYCKRRRAAEGLERSSKLLTRSRCELNGWNWRPLVSLCVRAQWRGARRRGKGVLFTTLLPQLLTDRCQVQPLLLLPPRWGAIFRQTLGCMREQVALRMIIIITTLFLFLYAEISQGVRAHAKVMHVTKCTCCCFVTRANSCSSFLSRNVVIV